MSAAPRSARRFVAPARHWLVVLALVLVLPLALVGPASARRSHHSTHHHHRHKGALPYMGPEPAPSIFGIDTAVWDLSHAFYVRDIPAARQLGGRYDHITLGPKTAAGDFGASDYEITQARKHHMGVILSFGGIPSACSLRPRPANVHACPPTTAADLRNYEAYVEKMVLRYRNVVDYYESWVEPNNKSSWLPGPNPGRYATVLKAQYTVLQSINHRYRRHLKLLFASPIGFLVAPSTAGWLAVLPYTSEVLANLHGQRPFDGIALHAYRFPPATDGPSAEVCDYVGGVPVTQGYVTSNCPAPLWRWLTWPQELTAYEQLFAVNGYGQQPLWLTEFGWPGNAQPNGDYFPSDDTQAAYLREAYADLLSLPFVQAAMWFDVRDYQPGLVTGDPAYFYHYGLLNYGFDPKSAAATFRSLAAANPSR